MFLLLYVLISYIHVHEESIEMFCNCVKLRENPIKVYHHPVLHNTHGYMYGNGNVRKKIVLAQRIVSIEGNHNTFRSEEKNFHFETHFLIVCSFLALFCQFIFIVTFFSFFLLFLCHFCHVFFFFIILLLYACACFFKTMDVLE